MDALCEKLKSVDKNNITVSAIYNGFYIMRMQPFEDGNERAESYAVNKILIENKKGIFNVSVESDGTFKQKFVYYHVSNDNSELKELVSEKCFTGTTKV